MDAANSDNVIGMIFLIDIDGWARSARIQVVLGKDYRGRGYSRDIMPRVMTYGLAPEPAGLGMHRIWVAVPEQNTRSVSVYQSLGFVPSGRSRDALWNASQNRYQDLIVMDTLVDEFDPIRSLDAFGMHVIEDNPGVKEALSAREHSIAIRLNEKNASKHDAEGTDVNDAAAAAQSVQKASSDGAGDVAEAVRKDAEGAEPARQSEHDDRKSVTGDADAENSWPYTAGERKTSKEAWWRTLGRGRKRDTEGK
ncbi:MAG: GNAT family N-acetyltransferase [Bifidobacterium sp.]